MNIASIATTVLSGVVTSGAAAVVGNAIKASTPADATTLKKVSIGVGGLVLSGLAGHHASNYASETATSTIDSIRALKAGFSKKSD